MLEIREINSRALMFSSFHFTAQTAEKGNRALWWRRISVCNLQNAERRRPKTYCYSDEAQRDDLEDITALACIRRTLLEFGCCARK